MTGSIVAPSGRKRLLVWYHHAIRFLAGTTMLTIVVIMTLQVAARYIFDASLIWAEELCRYILIWQTFLFIGMAYSKGELVAVDIVPGLLTPRLRLALKGLMSIPILTFLVLMTINGYDYSTRFGAQIVPALDFIWMQLTGHPIGVPIFWVYVSVPLGSALLALHVVGSLITDFRAVMSGHAVVAPHHTTPQA